MLVRLLKNEKVIILLVIEKQRTSDFKALYRVIMEFEIFIVNEQKEIYNEKINIS